MEKIQNHWLAAMGIIGTLILLAFVGNIWNSYSVIKKQGQEARNEIKQDDDAFKNELKTAKEDIENAQFYKKAKVKKVGQRVAILLLFILNLC